MSSESKLTRLTYTAKEVLSDIYRALLGRDPDEHGLFNYSTRLEHDKGTLQSIMEDILRSEEYQSKMQQEAVLASGREFWGHSQHGELRGIIEALIQLGSKHKFIVDVGARGKNRSNSYDLLRNFGWTGLLIECNPHLAQSILNDFSGCKVELETVAIASYDGFANFFIGSNLDVSSLSAGSVLHWGPIEETVRTKVSRLSEVLTRHSVPFDFDVLSLDIEGQDIDVLNDLIGHSGFRPQLIIVESHDDRETTWEERLYLSSEVRSIYRLIERISPNLIMGRHQTT